jgi:PleD family two-component response regulator
MVRDENDVQWLQGPFAAMLKTKGYSNERITEFFEKAKATAGKAQVELPKGVLNVNTTMYFLEREIKRHQRYNSPFSSLIVTAEAIGQVAGPLRSVNEEENRTIMSQVLQYLRRVLRDLDIVGSLGLVSRDVPFVVLPMTEGPGAACVAGRLEKDLNAMAFEYGGERVRAVFAISCASFDKKVMTGYRSFLETALSYHKKKQEQIHAPEKA